MKITITQRVKNRLGRHFCLYNLFPLKSVCKSKSYSGRIVILFEIESKNEIERRKKIKPKRKKMKQKEEKRNRKKKNENRAFSYQG